MAMTAWKLRTSLIALVMACLCSTFLILGSGILLYRLPQVVTESRQLAQKEASDIAYLLEYQLGGIQSQLQPTVAFLRSSHSIAEKQAHLDAIVGDGIVIEAVYIVNVDGLIEAVGLPALRQDRRADLGVGDFSANRLFRRVMDTRSVSWSDKYLSAMTGSFALGLAIPADDYVVIAEISPQAIVESVRAISRRIDHPALVVDSRGEWIADNVSQPETRLQNWAGHPAVRAALALAPPPSTVRLDGKPHHTGHDVSPHLGWAFIVGVPAGLHNAEIRATVWLVVGSFFAAALIGVALAPLWVTQFSAPLRRLGERMHRLALGDFSEPAAPPGRILEINEFADDIDRTARAIASREERIRELNAELEARVQRRTEALARSNQELSQALAHLKATQNDLVNAEKLAALGRLVAGIAHELNTPIGNALMASTTFREHLQEFRQGIEEGIKRQAFESFLFNAETATDISIRNLERGAQLINSFKRTAVDQTSDQRRVFNLRETVAETLAILQPSFKRTPFRVETDIPSDIDLDSYPGALEQVLSNLITNAIVHGFDERDHGCITLTADCPDSEHVRIGVADDGIGVPAALQTKIFDPFFTTKLGKGGSGLGLQIVQNSVTAILGGSITFSSTEGVGTHFNLVLPLTAPERQDGK